MLPDRLAIKSVCEKTAGAEVTVDALAIGAGSGSSGTAFVRKNGFEFVVRSFALPKLLTIASVVGESPEFAVLEGGQENAIVPDNGRGGAGRNSDFENLVSAGREIAWWLLGVGDARAVGAAKLRPIVGVDEAGANKAGQKQRVVHRGEDKRIQLYGEMLDFTASVYHCINMRTTVTLDDDIFEAAQAQSKASGERLGKVLSTLARRGLQAGNRQVKGKPGLPVFKVSSNAKIIPSDRARELMEEDLL